MYITILEIHGTVVILDYYSSPSLNPRYNDSEVSVFNHNYIDNCKITKYFITIEKDLKVFMDYKLISYYNEKNNTLNYKKISEYGSVFYHKDIRYNGHLINEPYTGQYFIEFPNKKEIAKLKLIL